MGLTTVASRPCPPWQGPGNWARALGSQGPGSGLGTAGPGPSVFHSGTPGSPAVAREPATSWGAWILVGSPPAGAWRASGPRDGHSLTLSSKGPPCPQHSPQSPQGVCQGPRQRGASREGVGGAGSAGLSSSSGEGGRESGGTGDRGASGRGREQGQRGGLDEVT